MRQPTTDLTKNLDSLLCHLDWTLCLIDGSDARRRERDALFAANTVLDAADLSFLPIDYPAQFRAYFALALQANPAAAVGLVSASSHYEPLFQVCFWLTCP